MQFQQGKQQFQQGLWVPYYLLWLRPHLDYEVKGFGSVILRIRVATGITLLFRHCRQMRAEVQHVVSRGQVVLGLQAEDAAHAGNHGKEDAYGSRGSKRGGTGSVRAVKQYCKNNFTGEEGPSQGRKALAGR